MKSVFLHFKFILLGTLLLLGCESSISGSNFAVNNPVIRTDSIDYLALGDSYTIGQSVATSQRWPNQLVSSLESAGFRVNELRIIAQTGWTTTDLLRAIEAADLNQYNLVSLLIGVNNQYQGKPFTLFETEFELLLNKAISLAGGPENVFIVSIPDYGVTPFGSANSSNIAMEIDEYNAHMEEVCQALEIPFINVTSISRLMGAQEGALAQDNLHPSGEQYSRWVGTIYPVVRDILNK